jgi:hypothetical protein
MLVSLPNFENFSLKSSRKALRTLFGLAALVASGAACDAAPRDRHIQWVARDAWNPGCADKAIIERWVQTNGAWKEKGKVWRVDIDATFKLGNDCEGEGENATIPAYQSIDFKRNGLELVPCKSGDEEGWALPGQEGARCWTRPKLVSSTN